MTNTTAAGTVDVTGMHDAAAACLDEDLDLVAQLVGIDSGRDHPAGIEAVQRAVAERAATALTHVHRSDGPVPHTLIRRSAGHRRVAIITHADTVFPAGTAADRPYRRVGDRAYGPGVADMKGGLVLALRALATLAETGLPHTSVDLLIVGDEEVRTTPPPFLDVVATADAAVVLECGRPGGGFVTARKAGLWATLVATGKAAHSGTSKAAGSNAIDALASEVVRIARLDRDHPELTISTGMISGGTSVNTVPARAEAWFDVRAHQPSALAEALSAMRTFAVQPGVELDLIETEHWPPMAPTAAARQLAERYEALAASLGVPVHRVSTGGMSDGTWLSAAGVPTIDGLGPIGDADHSPEEWMAISSFPARAALLAGLLAELEQPSRSTKE